MQTVEACLSESNKIHLVFFLISSALESVLKNCGIPGITSNITASTGAAIIGGTAN